MHINRAHQLVTFLAGHPFAGLFYHLQLGPDLFSALHRHRHPQLVDSFAIPTTHISSGRQRTVPHDNFNASHRRNGDPAREPTVKAETVTGVLVCRIWFAFSVWILIDYFPIIQLYSKVFTVHLVHHCLVIASHLYSYPRLVVVVLCTPFVVGSAFAPASC